MLKTLTLAAVTAATFAAMFPGPANALACRYCSMNGRNAQGTSVNGLSWNGKVINGITVSGGAVTGQGTAGMRVVAVELGPDAVRQPQ